MKRYFLYLFLIFICLPTFALRGHDKGNGGDVLVCNDQKGQFLSAEFFDFAEAKALRSWDIKPNVQGLSTMEYVLSALENLEAVDSRRADFYKEQALNFFKETQFIANANFRDIDDSEHIFIPKNCHMEQLIHQQEPTFPGDKRYFINLDWWEKLSDFYKAGAIVHEILYRELNVEDSKGLRAFNAMIFANLFSTMSLKDIVDIYRSVGFEWWSYSRVILDLMAPMEWFNEYKVKVGKPVDIYKEEAYYVLFNQKLYLRGKDVDFYENGQVKSFYFGPPLRYPSLYGDLMVSTRDLYRLVFYDSGEVKKIYLNDLITLKSNTFEIHVGRIQAGGAHIGSPLEFYKSGKLRWVGTGHGKIFDGQKWITIGNVYGGILLDEKGWFIKQTPKDNKIP